MTLGAVERRDFEQTDRRSARDIGRRARLDLVFQHRRGRTVLGHAYAEPPFRIGRTFDMDGALYLIVVCAGPGVFAGDDLHQTVIVESGARVLLASQSALQVHPANAADPTRIRHEYRVENGGELHCVWDPIIPFANARVEQRFDIALSGDSRLYWSDALMSGRCSRAESWKFRALAHELRLTVDGSLRYLERYRLAPSNEKADSGADGGAEGETGRALGARWIADEVDYVGTSLVYHEAASEAFAERLHRLLGDIADVRAGVDLADTRLLIARMLSRRGAAFARARQAVREAALETLFESPGLVARR